MIDTRETAGKGRYVTAELLFKVGLDSNGMTLTVTPYHVVEDNADDEMVIVAKVENMAKLVAAVPEPIMLDTITTEKITSAQISTPTERREGESVIREAWCKSYEEVLKMIEGWYKKIEVTSTVLQ